MSNLIFYEITKLFCS